MVLRDEIDERLFTETYIYDILTLYITLAGKSLYTLTDILVTDWRFEFFEFKRKESITFTRRIINSS